MRRHPVQMFLCSLLLVAVLTAGCGRDDRTVSEQPATVSFDEAAVPTGWYHGRPLYELHVRAFSPTGDLAGVQAGLDRLAGLGRPNLILTPLNPVGEKNRTGELGNLYAVRDHRAIDPTYGTKDDLKRTVEAAHQRGMGVLLDVVMCAGSVDHVALAANPRWFARDAAGNLTRRMLRWDSLAEFDFSNGEVSEYLTGTLAFWVEETGIDGFRFALPTFAPDEFWEALVLDLRDRFPHLALVAEASDTRYLSLGFDSIYAPGLKVAIDECRLEDMAQWGLREDVVGVVESMEKLVRGEQTFITFIEDHFNPRSASLYTPEYLGGFAALLAALPGTPQLLMGQEVGCEVPPNPQDSWQVDWAGGDPSYTKIYAEALRLRRLSPELQSGDFQVIPVEDQEVLVMSRTLGADAVLCALNLSNGRPHFTLPDELAAGPWRAWDGNDFSGEATGLQGDLTVDPGWFRMWRRGRD